MNDIACAADVVCNTCIGGVGKLECCSGVNRDGSRHGTGGAGEGERAVIDGGAAGVGVAGIEREGAGAVLMRPTAFELSIASAKPTDKPLLTSRIMAEALFLMRVPKLAAPSPPEANCIVPPEKVILPVVPRAAVALMPRVPDERVVPPV